MLYSPITSQKTAAAIVSAVTTSFFPAVVLDSIECDSQGFDLFFSSDIELCDPLFQVLQEEIRRRKAKASIRSFSMMPSLISSYALNTHKQIGPLSDLYERTLADVCEVDSFCCLIEGPHEEEKETLGEIVITVFACSKKGKTYQWHIRGCSVPNKKEAREVKIRQKKVWEKNAKTLLEAEGNAVFSQQGMLILPKGMQIYQDMRDKISSGMGQCIQVDFLPEVQVSSDVEFVQQLVQRKKILQQMGAFSHDVLEEVKVCYPMSFRLPLGFLGRYRARVCYCFSKTPVQYYSNFMLSSLRSLNFSPRVSLVAKNDEYFDCVEKLLYDSLLDQIPCVREKYLGELREKAIIFFQAEHRDGRIISLAAYMIDCAKKQPLLFVPALSLERLVGFYTETL